MELKKLVITRILVVNVSALFKIATTLSQGFTPLIKAKKCNAAKIGARIKNLYFYFIFSN